jgi:hypothetical protein
MGAQDTKLIVLHGTAQPAARRDAEVFWDLARGTGGCVVPCNTSVSGRLRDILSAVAVYAVGDEKLRRERRHDLPGALALLEHLGERNCSTCVRGKGLAGLSRPRTSHCRGQSRAPSYASAGLFRPRNAP